ncbi:MAG: molybdopterin oxidoreductase [Tenericutes bacterium HGW-Tenericutes-3]|nr:MAG: molybdopterin oxidoreductase [Tenericutes bacterium HGW-Tenericutes-3]
MKEMICIACPIGCHLQVDDQLKVSGNLCIKGEKYAIEEMTHPTRILTTTVKTISPSTPRVSVKSREPIPKELIFKALLILDGIIIKNNVKIGDIIVKDILNTGIDMIATKNLTIDSIEKE